MKKNNHKTSVRTPTFPFVDNVLNEVQERVTDITSSFAAEVSGKRLAHARGSFKEVLGDKFLATAVGWLNQAKNIDLDTLKAFKYIAESTMASYKEALARREKGEYEVDEFGLDPEVVDLIRPFFSFLYEKWWRVQAVGIENIPSEGPALLVANHSGVLPWDGTMITTAVLTRHPKPRMVRPIILDWFMKLPVLSPLMAQIGAVLACPENAERLLSKGHLVCVFPEGIKGTNKLYKNRYRLARFGRGGFARTAIRTKVPIVPVSVVGAEEIYPVIAQADPLVKWAGVPYFPITPLWPWFGLLGMIPLPTKWTITFGQPIPTDAYRPINAENFLAVSRLSNRVRDAIQQTLNKTVIRRTSIFA